MTKPASPYPSLPKPCSCDKEPFHDGEGSCLFCGRHIVGAEIPTKTPVKQLVEALLH